MRHSKPRSHLFLTLSLALLLCAGAEASQFEAACDVRYTLLDLGTLPGGGFSHARAVNNRGQAVGVSGLSAPGQSSAFLWSCGDGMEDIGASSGLPDTSGEEVNERGQVLLFASAQWPELSPTMLFWDRRIGALVIDPEKTFYPSTLTDSGQVTDGSRIWTVRTGLQPINIGIPTYDARLTNFGRLSGVTYDDTGANPQLFTWTARTGVKYLGTPPGSILSTEDINDRGDLLLQSFGDQGPATFIVDRFGRLTPLEKPPGVFNVLAWSINLHRDVVGHFLLVGGDRSFKWDPATGYQNLDELLFGTVGNDARFRVSDINDWGWISGNVDDRAMLAIPVPARDSRFENLNSLRGPQLCRALNQIKLHRLLCSLGK